MTREGRSEVEENKRERAGTGGLTFDHSPRYSDYNEINSSHLGNNSYCTKTYSHLSFRRTTSLTPRLRLSLSSLSLLIPTS